MKKHQREAAVSATLFILIVITWIALAIAITLDAHHIATNIAVVLVLLGVTSTVFTIYYTFMD